jgi:biopolymer transport protein ExbB/TolQ
MKKRHTFLIGMVLGAMLAFSPVFGLLGTVIPMAHAFSLLGHSGVADPKALSVDIGGVLLSTTMGVVLCPVGLVLFVVSLIFYLRTTNVPALTAPSADA